MNTFPNDYDPLHGLRRVVKITTEGQVFTEEPGNVGANAAKIQQDAEWQRLLNTPPPPETDAQKLARLIEERHEQALVVFEQQQKLALNRRAIAELRRKMPTEETDHAPVKTNPAWRRNQPETIDTNERGGMQSKLDVRYDLLDGRAMDRLAAVLAHGAKTYAPDNWRLIDVGDHLNHALKHLMDFTDIRAGRVIGDAKDELAHAFCRLFMAVAVDEQGGPSTDTTLGGMAK